MVGVVIRWWTEETWALNIGVMEREMEYYVELHPTTFDNALTQMPR